MCTSYTPSSIISNTKTDAFTFLCFGLSSGYSYKLPHFKPDLKWYCIYSCASNHAHIVPALHPVQIAFGLWLFRHYSRPWIILALSARSLHICVREDIPTGLETRPT